MKNIRLLGALLVCVALIALSMTGCSDPADGSANTASGDESAKYLPLTIATAPTDDMFPFWVAQEEGIFDELDLDVTIELFPSGAEMMAAVTANEAQGFLMTMTSGLQMNQGGTSVMAATRLGPSRGGFVSSPKSGITEASQLAGVPIAATEASIEEYVLERALAKVGVASDQIVLEAMPQLPMRIEMLTNNNIKAAGMPWSMASMMAEKGAHILITEKDVVDYTSTALGIRKDWLDKPKADATVKALWVAWDKAIELINANPEKYLPLLAEKANLPAEAVDNYEMQVYAPAQHLDRDQVESIFSWMVEKGYVEAPMTYDEFVYQGK